MSFDQISINDLSNCKSNSTTTRVSDTDCAQYYKNIETNLEFYKNALKTAEALIDKYMTENRSLCLQIDSLNENLQKADKKIDVLEIAIKNSTHCQGTVKDLTTEVEKLLGMQKGYEARIEELSRKI